MNPNAHQQQKKVCCLVHLLAMLASTKSLYAEVFETLSSSPKACAFVQDDANDNAV